MKRVFIGRRARATSRAIIDWLTDSNTEVESSHALLLDGLIRRKFHSLFRLSLSHVRRSGWWVEEVCQTLPPPHHDYTTTHLLCSCFGRSFVEVETKMHLGKDRVHGVCTRQRFIGGFICNFGIRAHPKSWGTWHSLDRRTWLALELPGEAWLPGFHSTSGFALALWAKKVSLLFGGNKWPVWKLSKIDHVRGGEFNG